MLKFHSAFLCPGICAIILFGCTTPPQIKEDQIQYPIPPSEKPAINTGVSQPTLSVQASEPAIRKVLQQQGPYKPLDQLGLCGGVVSNAPPVDDNGYLINYTPYINVKGIKLALAPVNDTCLSSAFGPRWSSHHYGIDLAAMHNAPAYSAGAGRIISARHSPSYGNMVVLRHSEQVYTRYAHLEIIDELIQVGRTIGTGQRLGLIGKTGIAHGIHLHYEILITDEKGNRQATDPFSYPAFVD